MASNDEDSVDRSVVFDNDDPRSALEMRLRQEINKAKDTSANAGDVLAAITNFLTSWEALEDDSRSRSELKLPCEFLRQTICQAQQHLGHGHDALQKPILSMLRALHSYECRSLVLELVPLVLPFHTHEKSIGSVMRVGARNAKKELFTLLQDIVQDDASLLKQIMDEFVRMTVADLLLSKDVFQFSLEILPKTPENELHAVIQALFRFAETVSEAQDAVDAVRTELSLLEKTDVSDMFSVISVFDSLFRGSNSSVVVEQYLTRCEEIVEESYPKPKKKKTLSESLDQDGVLYQLSVFDLSFMLLAKEKDTYLERVAVVIHRSIAKGSFIFWDLCPTKFVQLVGETDAPASAGLRDRLFDSYIDTCLTMYLSFCILKRAAKEFLVFNAVNFVTKAILAVPRVYQERMIRRLLNLFNSLVLQCQKEGSFGKRDLHTEEEESRGGKGRIMACREIISIAVGVANEDSSVMAPFLPQLSSFLEADDIHCPQQDASIVTKLCKVIAVLSLKNTQDELMEGSILLCRKLLFVHRDPTTSSQRQLRGLELINAIVREKNNTFRHVDPLGRLMTRLLETNSLASSQNVGVEAIKITRYLHLQKGITFDGKEAIGRVLSKERVIQYPENGNGISHNEHAVIRYGNVPQFLLRRCKSKPQKFPAMICTFESCLASDVSQIRPSKWEKSVLWHYTLLEAFLVIGRPLKWIPQAWTEAGIQFPSVPSKGATKGDKRRRLAVWLQESFGRFCSEDRSNTENAGDIIEDAIHECTRASERNEILQFAYKFTLSLMLGLSVSAAVLNNVYDYFKEAFEGHSSQERSEPTTLVQHQLVKLYDLKHHIQSMQRLFVSLSKKKRKKGKTSHKRASHSGKSEAAEQIDKVFQHFFSSESYVDIKAVWIALSDTEHDAFVISSLDGKDVPDLSDGHLQSIFHMRLCMLSDLSCRLKAGIRPENLSSDASEFRQRMARFLRMASFLSLRAQNMNEAVANMPILTLVENLSLGYFRLLHNVLVSMSNISINTSTAEEDYVAFFFNLYFSLVRSEDPMNDAIHQDSDIKLSSIEHFKTLGISCIDICQRCTSRVANQLLETLSVFAIKASHIIPEVLDSMIDLHWEVMKVKFHSTHSMIINETLFGMDVFVHRFVTCRLPSESNVKRLRETLFQLTSTESQSEEHWWLAHHMCRHWCLVALSQRRTELLVDHLARFLSELRDYLEDNDKPQEISVPVAIFTTETAKPDRTDGVNNSMPRTDRTFPSSDSFPSLTSDTCAEYFETLLKLTVVSIEIFLVEDEIEDYRSHSSRSLHPFAILENYFEMCGTLVEILKNDTFVLFPETIPTSVMKALKLLLDVSTEKIETCIDWQFSNGRSKELMTGAPDLAAGAGVLKDLIDIFCVEIIGSMERLCTEKKSNDNRTASLSRKIGKVFDGVRRACLEFDLGDVKTQYSDVSDNDAEPKSKRRKTEVLKPQFDASTIEEPQEQDGTEKKANDNVDYHGENVDEEASASGNSDEDDSSASCDFGVSGDWGHGNHSEDISGDDDSSRQLGEITITH
ncbi:hypothetical protein IV203_018411 [Nitzschia inconspicua]|uniref:Uncharacterized protein n=1 Tax=Nitzschia inconspicua TaxID=303405 RepID=A0A9K3Q5Y8_9STRA|nr:hypothetical protein IV203_018411 [Nitzschia inconspicua]